MRPRDAQRLEQGSGVIGEVGDGIVSGRLVAIAGVAVVHRNGAVLAAKDIKLPRPAQSLRPQPRQQQDGPLLISGIGGPRLIIGELAPVDQHALRRFDIHDGFLSAARNAAIP